MRWAHVLVSAGTFAATLSVSDRVSAEPAHASAAAEAAPEKPLDPKSNFREKGRFGVIGVIAEDMWKGGLVFEHEQLEVHASHVFQSGGFGLAYLFS